TLTDNSVVDVKGDSLAIGIGTVGGAIEVVGSEIRANSRNEAWGIVLEGGAVALTAASVQVNADGIARGALVLGNATLDSTFIQAAGAEASAVTLAYGTLRTSGGTALQSSGQGTEL